MLPLLLSHPNPLLSLPNIYSSTLSSACQYTYIQVYFVRIWSDGFRRHVFRARIPVPTAHRHRHHLHTLYGGAGGGTTSTSVPRPSIIHTLL